MNSESLRESNKLLCNSESLRETESAPLLSNDIIRLIGLKLGLEDIISFILSFSFLNNDDYFWQLYYYIHYKDYVNPLNLSYKELFKRKYQYTDGYSYYDKIELPNHLSFMHKQCKTPTEKDLLDLINGWRRAPGSIITFYEYIDVNTLTTRKYTYIVRYLNNRLISAKISENLTHSDYYSSDYAIFIDPCFNIIDKYPINHWGSSFDYVIFYIDNKIYLDQISKNMVKVNYDSSEHSHKSRFIDWRGIKHKIYLKKQEINDKILVVLYPNNTSALYVID
jgi:hypothetical protein